MLTLWSPIACAQEKIASLRYRHQSIADSLAPLEERVANNTARLERISQSYGDDYDDYDTGGALQLGTLNVTDDDIEKELEEIRDLEQKKRVLEDRVGGMERDLGGLMR